MSETTVLGWGDRIIRIDKDSGSRVIRRDVHVTEKIEALADV